MRKSSSSLQGVRVSGGDLCEAEAPTEPTGETFRQNAITIFRWCIIAPLSPSRVFALVRFLRFSPALNQQIQLLLNRFALEDEGQQLHHILIGQDGRLFQKGLQHSGTSAKPMGSLASGQPFQLALQTLLLVLGCGQLRSATYCLCLSFSNSSLMGNFSFLIMGKTKATNFLRLIAFGLGITLFYLQVLKMKTIASHSVLFELFLHRKPCIPNPTRCHQSMSHGYHSYG